MRADRTGDVISDVVYTFKSETVEWVGFQSFLIKRAADRTGGRAWVRRYRGQYAIYSNAGHGPAFPSQHGRGKPQYLPSNAKIGLRCFHAPAVKSGNSSVWKLFAIDCSLNGVIALQVTAS